jgi:hypothetical protein
MAGPQVSFLIFLKIFFAFSWLVLVLVEKNKNFSESALTYAYTGPHNQVGTVTGVPYNDTRGRAGVRVDFNSQSNSWFALLSELIIVPAQVFYQVTDMLLCQSCTE